VHCAVGTSWKPEEVRRVTVDGTRTVAEAALAAGVKRFVHISTLFVHRRSGGGVIDESTPLAPPANDQYGQTKLAAEQALAQITSRGLSTFVLRPTRIYGPFSRTFTLRPLQALTEGRLAIGGPPDVPANMVYVDNVAAAIEQALDANDSAADAYLITDSEQLTLREFYEYFGRPWGLALKLLTDWREASESANPSWLSALGTGMKTIATSSELRGFVRRVFETDPIGTLPRRLWERSPQMQQRLLTRFGADAAVVYRAAPQAGLEDLVYVGEEARVSGAKAHRSLGDDRVPARLAMERTRAWAQYARVLPQASPGDN
jgi:dTDP-4-dehydrorhamnose reductase